MAMKPNTKAVLEYLKSVHGKKDVTAADVAAELGLDVKQVNGILPRLCSVRSMATARKSRSSWTMVHTRR